MKTSITWERKQSIKLVSTESPRKDKLKEEHTETHSNQTDRKLKTDKILKATREK